MVNLINSWMKGIIYSVIITIIIEMLLPEGKNKKYIKTVISIYIVYVIIAPICSKLLNKRVDTSLILKNYKVPEMQVNTIDNNKYIIENYETRIKENIIENLKTMGYDVLEIKVRMNTNDESYGKIEKINLSIKRMQRNDIKMVERVKIGGNDGPRTEEELNEEDKKVITDYLITNYGVLNENIIIGG